jgi:hypothetical protein
VKQYRVRLLQSASAFAAAIFITLIVHEFAHGLTARLIYGLHPTVYGLHEKDIASSRGAVGVIAGAGPVVSLIVGAIVLWGLHRPLRGQGYARYLTLWVGILGIATFFGYLLTAPFFAEGDVGVVLKSAGLNTWAGQWLTFVLGVAGFVLVAKLAVPFFLAMTNSELPLRPQMFSLGLFAWLLGGVVVLALTFPAFPFMILATGFIAPQVGFFASRRDPDAPYGEPAAAVRVSLFGLALLAALTIIEQTVLRFGVHL